MPKDRGSVDDVDLVDGVEPWLAWHERIAELEAEVAQLREALVQRQLYGVVTGVLSARYGISPERAWQFVVRLSQDSNLKVQVIARVIHDRFFDRLAPEDEALAARLDVRLCGQLGPLTPATVKGKVQGDGRR
jgi:hypothetical protein